MYKQGKLKKSNTNRKIFTWNDQVEVPKKGEKKQ